MNLAGVAVGAILIATAPNIWYVGALFILIGLVAPPDSRADT